MIMMRAKENLSPHGDTPANPIPAPDINYVLFRCQQTAFRWIFNSPFNCGRRSISWCWAYIRRLAKSVRGITNSPATTNFVPHVSGVKDEPTSPRNTADQ